METFFLTVLNMSLTGICAVMIVLAARLFLKKAPKIYSYLLWLIVFFRFACPFSLKSVCSLIPVQSDSIPVDIALERFPKVNTGVESLDFVINPVLPKATPYSSSNPLQLWISLGSIIWCAILVGLLLYSVITLFLLKRRLKNAAVLCSAEELFHTSDSKRSKIQIFLAGNLGTPFVLGVFRPRIYLPKDVPPEERKLVLMHEFVHIRRKDALVKMLCFLVACVHWFNPFAWLAFVLMSRDMEMACDEAVLERGEESTRKAYSSSLLKLSTPGSGVKAPLAFGENAVKTRIKNILSFKKKSKIVWIISGIAACVVMGALLLSPARKKDDSLLNVKNLIPEVQNMQRVQVGGEGDDLLQRNVGVVILSGENIASWMEETVWKEKKVNSPYERIPSYTILSYPGETPAFEIRLYDDDIYNDSDEPEMAMVIIGEEWRYYTINKGACRNLHFLTMISSSYQDELLYSMAELEKQQVNIIWNTLEICFETLMSPEGKEEVLLSQNPSDYLEANPVVHKQILDYQDYTLKYCYEQFEKGGQTGLKGQLMMLICLELQGYNIDTLDGISAMDDVEYSNGQEWYDAIVHSDEQK